MKLNDYLWRACLLGLVLCANGCTTQGRWIVATGTLIGVEIAQNPSSQMYQAKLGYQRAELALLPTNNTANVIMELRYGSIFSLSEASIYQRLAVGDIAVAQPGASLMFAKSVSGQLDPVTAMAITRNVKSIPATEPDLMTQLLPAAKAFSAAADKSGFEAVAAAHGYASFSDFLTDNTLTSAKAKTVLDDLKSKSLIP